MVELDNDEWEWLMKEILKRTSASNGHNVLLDKCAKGTCEHFG